MRQDFYEACSNDTLNDALQVEKVDQVVQRLLRENQREYDIHVIRERVHEITEIVRDFLTRCDQDGKPDEWHNFAVSLARHDHYALACEVLDRALALGRNKKNTDLLADYLQFGMCCNREEQCHVHYETLKNIHRVKYSWRAFSFSIDYLMHLWEESDTLEEMDRLEKEMFNLADDFQKYFPKLEEGYSSKADIYSKLRMHDKVIETLEEALKKLPRTPKCALQLADAWFEECEYKKALDALSRAVKNANQPQQGINSGYARCLMGLSMLADAELKGDAITEELIRNVYLEFNLAVSREYRHAPYRNTVKEKTKEISLRYDVQVPMEFEDLHDLVSN